MKRRFSVQIVLILGVLAISGAAILIRQADAEPIAIAFYRMLFSAVMLLPCSARFATPGSPGRQWKRWLQLGFS